MGLLVQHLKLTTEIRTGYNEVFILEDFHNANEYLNILSPYLTDIADIEDEGKIKKGFYAVYIAEQNKGFVPQFDRQFKSENLYFGKHSFMLAHELCDYEWKGTFKEDFIDNFEDAKSFFVL